MKNKFLLAALTALSIPALHAEIYTDDIYYDPRKANKTTTQKKQSNYIANFQDQDVDAYNRRGQYYTTPIDTIGSNVENGEDFVYTQQIQKFYNPTIVVDNSDLLSDILQNSYGNVDIVYNYGSPYFLPSYCSYNSWWPSISFGGWGWNISWGYPWYTPSFAWTSPWYNPWWGPSWSWGWGPSWAWSPSWNWGWGPSWGPGFVRPGRPYYADYRPGGHRPVGPRPGWSANTRPGGNNTAGARPGWSSNTRPGNNMASGGFNSTHRPGGVSQTTRPSQNGHNNGVGNTSVRPVNTGSSTTRPNVTINNNGHRGQTITSNPVQTRPVNTTVNKNQVTTTPNNNGSKRGGYTVPSTTTNKSSNSYTPSNSNSTKKSYNSTSTRSGGYSTGSSRGGYSGGSSRGGFSGGGSRGGGHRR